MSDFNAYNGVKLVDILDLIGHDCDHTNYCDPYYYMLWEHHIARPLLIKHGYTVDEIVFHTLEGDSFGPLTRGILVSKDGQQYMAWYG